MSKQSNNDRYHLQKPYQTHTSPHAYVNQQSPNQASFDFSQSVVELFQRWTELIHSTQWFHQQTTDALNDIAKSSSFKKATFY